MEFLFQERTFLQQSDKLRYHFLPLLIFAAKAAQSTAVICDKQSNTLKTS